MCCWRVTDEDFSQATQSAPEGSAKSGAKCGALSPHSSTPHDAGLSEVISVWPELPAALKSGILAMVRAFADPQKALPKCSIQK